MAENRSKKSICQQFPTIGQLLFSIVKNVQKWGKKDKTKKNEARGASRMREFGEIAPKSGQPRAGNLIALLTDGGDVECYFCHEDTIIANVNFGKIGEALRSGPREETNVFANITIYKNRPHQQPVIKIRIKVAV